MRTYRNTLPELVFKEFVAGLFVLKAVVKFAYCLEVEADLSGSKRRPALVLADLPGDDIILCQITSQSTDNSSIPIDNHPLQSGRYLCCHMSGHQGFLQRIKKQLSRRQVHLTKPRTQLLRSAFTN